MDMHKLVDFVAMASKRRAYSVTTNLQAIEAAEKSSKEAAASHFSMDCQAIWHGSSTRGVDSCNQGVTLTCIKCIQCESPLMSRQVTPSSEHNQFVCIDAE